MFRSFKSRGLAKLGNVVAQTLLRRQMFRSLAAQETSVAETNFAAGKQENVFTSGQKWFCFPHKFHVRNIGFPV